MEKDRDLIEPRYAVVPAEPGWEAIEIFANVTELNAGHTLDDVVLATPIVAWAIEISAPEFGAQAVIFGEISPGYACRSPKGVVFCRDAGRFQSTEAYVIHKIGAPRK